MNATQTNYTELAAKVGAENWIIEGSAQSGWYTCILTGKKFRAAAANEQFAKQEILIAEHEREQQATLDKEREDVLAGFDHKTDVLILTAEQHERLMENGLTDLSKRQYDLYTFSRDGMSGSLWDHLNNVEPQPDGTAPKQVKLIEIKCCECGAERKIKPQDRFQVTRCVPCQVAHRNAIRADKRKAKRAAAKVQQSQE